MTLPAAPGRKDDRFTAGLRSLACLAMLLAACGSPGPPLNSERIAERFGSYGVDVLQSTADLRVSSLYSGNGDSKITRTFAVVSFPGRVPAGIRPEDAAVRSGGSLGAVFKAAGWTIQKHNIFIGEVTLAARHALVADLMEIGLPAKVAAHVYRFVVQQDDASYSYARIVELHHPAYLSVDDLTRIYGEILYDDSNRGRIDDFIDPELWEN